ncbi:MAG: ATP-binding protein [Planctomycetota bacterium]|nr:ATP-binding protein [Planctomycetota bacterium]
MRQVFSANFVPCVGMPMMAFGLATILPSDVVGWSLSLVLSIWTLFALILCFRPRLRRLQESIDLGGSLALASLTGGVVSPFASMLPVVVLISGARHGIRFSFLQATITSIVITLATYFSATGVGAQSITDIGPPLVAMTLALHGVALLSGRLKGRWSALEEQHDLIVHALEEGIMVLDSEGCVVRANPAARTALGFSVEKDWRGQHISQFLKRTSDEEFRSALTHPRKRPQAIEWTGREGEERSFLVRTTEVENGLLVSVFTDRTSERRVVEAEARLLHLEELEELALGLAHEIRNPLASLRGAAAEIVSGKLPREQAVKMEQIVRRESDRLDRTVNEFLEYTRSRRLKGPRPISMASVAQEVIDAIDQREDARGLEITHDLDGAITVLANPDEIHRVINNLAINAVEACSGKGRVHFRVSGRDDFSVLEVSDDGVGMSSEVQSRAFHPFFSTKPREGGLGLAIVKKIVVTSGGWIELESSAGNGTQFRIGIPLAPQRELADVKVGA